MTPERLAKIRRDFDIIDNLPPSVRRLVHEYGAKRVCDLYARGRTPEQIEQHFENRDIFSALF